MAFRFDLYGGEQLPVIAGKVQRQEAALGGASVEYDLDGDGTRDGIAFSRHDGAGTFWFDLSRHGLLPGAQTIHLRAAAWDNQLHKTVQGEWQEFSLTLGEPQAAPLPRIDALQLAASIGNAAEQRTATPTILGTASWSDDNGGNFLIEYELLEDNSGTGSAIALSSREGAFTLALDAAGLTIPDVQLRVRARGWDDRGKDYISPWQMFGFTLVEATNALPEIASIGLAEDTGELGDGVSRSATLSGTVTHADGGTAVIPVQFDLNGDGVADGFVNTLPDGSFLVDLNSQFTAGGGKSGGSPRRRVERFPASTLPTPPRMQTPTLARARFPAACSKPCRAAIPPRARYSPIPRTNTAATSPSRAAIPIKLKGPSLPLLANSPSSV